MSRPAPSPELGRLLHQRLLNGDLFASNDFCRAYLDWLAAELGRRQRSNDEQLIGEAVSQTLVDFCKQPDRFDPTRGELTIFLLHSAECDFVNLIQKESRRHKRHVNWNCVADDLPAGNYPGETDPLEQLIRAETHGARWERLNRVIAAWSPAEQAVFALLRDGVKSREPFAAALHVTDRPIEEQEREVKNAKDRLWKRLKREGFPHE